MGVRFRKSINLGGGVRLNVSKSGVGYSFGTKGARITKTAKGTTRTTLSVPGTGLSYVKETSNAKKQNKPLDRKNPEMSENVTQSPNRCANCGSEIKYGDKYCITCGAPIANSIETKQDETIAPELEKSQPNEPITDDTEAENQKSLQKICSLGLRWSLTVLFILCVLALDGFAIKIGMLAIAFLCVPIKSVERKIPLKGWVKVLLGFVLFVFLAIISPNAEQEMLRETIEPTEIVRTVSETVEKTDLETVAEELLPAATEELVILPLITAETPKAENETDGSIDETFGDNSSTEDTNEFDETTNAEVTENVEQTVENNFDSTVPTEVIKTVTSTYVLNKNTKVFHYSTCKSVRQMNQKNKIEFTGTRDEVFAKGYTPCNNCHP